MPGPEFEPRPPGQGGYDFPDTECDGWSAPGLTLRSASVRGAKHRYYRKPRQDAVRVAVHEATGSIAFAVADGVSSATHAEYGAAEAARAAVARLLQQLDAFSPDPADARSPGRSSGRSFGRTPGRSADRSPEPFPDGVLDLTDVAHAAAWRLHQLARQRSGRPEPAPSAGSAPPEQALGPSEVAALYATTLVTGVVRTGGADHRGGSAAGSAAWPAADSAVGRSAGPAAAAGGPAGAVVELCSVGDSGAWVLDLPSGRYHPLLGSKTGSETLFVSHEVSPLPHVPARPTTVTARLTPAQVLLVGTDGFGDPLGDGDGMVGSLFAHHLAAPPPPLWFAHLLDFSRETFDDDRSLLAVWPRGGEAHR